MIEHELLAHRLATFVYRWTCTKCMAIDTKNVWPGEPLPEVAPRCSCGRHLILITGTWYHKKDPLATDHGTLDSDVRELVNGQERYWFKDHEETRAWKKPSSG